MVKVLFVCAGNIQGVMPHSICRISLAIDQSQYASRALPFNRGNGYLLAERTAQRVLEG